MTLIIEIALGIVLGFLILKNLDAIFALGAIAVGGAIALAILAVVGVGLYLGWEWIASHQRVLVGVIVLTAILVGSFMQQWLSSITGLKEDEGWLFIALSVVSMMAAVTFPMMLYEWTGDGKTMVTPIVLFSLTLFLGWLWKREVHLIRQRRVEKNSALSHIAAG